MLTIEEALELVAKNVAPLAPRRVPLGEAAGLVLDEERDDEGKNHYYFVRKPAVR